MKRDMHNPHIIYRLISDNYDCYVSESAYREITLQMRSGDYGSHAALRLEIWSSEIYEDLRWHSGVGLIDLISDPTGDDPTVWHHYDGHGDCYVEFHCTENKKSN
jgi:hypothetical protein